MQLDLALESLFTEQAVQQNIVTGITVTGSVIIVNLEPKVEARYVRPDCQAPVSVVRHDSEVILVQGLGLPGKALRYQVKTVRLAYVNEAGKFTTFTVPIPGIRTDLLVTDEVVEKALYLTVDRNIPLPIAAEMLQGLYQVTTSPSALDRWKTAKLRCCPRSASSSSNSTEKKDYRPPSRRVQGHGDQKLGTGDSG